MACACKASKRTYLQLIDKQQINDKTYTFNFTPIEPLRWKEGDSSALVVPIEGMGVEDSRKLSYASMPSEKVIQFTTRITETPSLYKKQLATLQKGDFVEATYPDGDFTLIRDGRPIVILSNGVGIATARSLIVAFIEDDSGIDHLTQINVDRSGAIFNNEFEAIESNHIGFRSFYSDNRGDFYDTLEEATRDIMFRSGRMPYFYLVGSDGFIDDMKLFLKRSGFEDMDIKTDQQGCGCGTTKLKNVRVTDKLSFSRPIKLKR